jgi:hypothetical protein
MKRIPLSSGQYALVDDCDFERVAQYRWHKAPKGFYPCSNIKGKKVYLHKFIMDCPEGFEMDHINRDRLDARRANLRVCTSSQNKLNIPPKKNNTLGLKGIKKNGRGWAAQFQWHGKSQFLGTYSTQEAAGRAYDRAAHAAAPEFACLNFSDGIWSEDRLEFFRISGIKAVSGFMGVRQVGSRFAARLRSGIKNLYLGTFDTPEQAHAAVLQAKSNLLQPHE